MLATAWFYYPNRWSDLPNKKLFHQYFSTRVHVRGSKRPDCHAGCQEVSRCHTSGEWSIQLRGSTLVLKPRTDITRSSKQGYQWPHKKDWRPPKIKKKKIFNFKFHSPRAKVTLLFDAWHFFRFSAQGLFISSESERENFILGVNALETNFHFTDIDTEYFPLPFSVSFSQLAGTFLGNEFSRRDHYQTSIHLSFLSSFCQHNVQNTKNPSVGLQHWSQPQVPVSIESFQFI